MNMNFSFVLILLFDHPYHHHAGKRLHPRLPVET